MSIVSTATGTDATAGIKGLDIYLQIDNGGVDNGAGTNPVVPKITNINLIPSGGVFAADNAGGNEGLTLSPDSLLGYDAVSTNTGTTVQVPVNGVLGVVTLNASGVAPGVYDLYFGNVGENSNQFGDGSDSDYVNATGASPTFSGVYGGPTYLGDVITVVAVPEPATGLLLVSAASVALLGRRRRSAAL